MFALIGGVMMSRSDMFGAQGLAKVEAWISAGLLALAACLGVSAIVSYTGRFNLVEARADRMDEALYLELTRMTGSEWGFLLAAAVAGALAVILAVNACFWNRKAKP